MKSEGKLSKRLGVYNILLYIYLIFDFMSKLLKCLTKNSETFIIIHRRIYIIFYKNLDL